MVDEPHEVVKLLVARMESHPDEFKCSEGSRWYHAISDITEWGNETDKAAINAKLRDIRLNEAHEDAMDELLNGPERRRKQEEDAQYERDMIMKAAQRNTVVQQAAQTYAMQQQQMAVQKYGTSAGAFTPGIPATSLSGKSLAGTWVEETYNTLSNAGTVTTNTTLQLGGETLNESILKKLKKAAGL